MNSLSVNKGFLSMIEEISGCAEQEGNNGGRMSKIHPPKPFRSSFAGNAVQGALTRE